MSILTLPVKFISSCPYRRIENPRIVLLDCPLEYKKGESQTNVEMSAEADFAQLLKLEEEYIQKMCDEIIAVKPDLVFTEKGVSGVYSYVDAACDREIVIIVNVKIWLSTSF